MARARTAPADVAAAFSAGGIVLLLDDRDGRGAGALLCAAEHCTAEAVNLLATWARGLICLALPPEQIEALGLPLMPRTDPDLPAFTVSVEAATGVTTGISAADRARTVAVAIDPSSTREDLVSPGHLFPVRVHPGGVLAVQSPSEAAVDLARIAGCRAHAGVWSDVLSASGDLANEGELLALAEAHDLPVLALSDLTRFRMARERIVRRVESGPVPTRFGDLSVSVWENLLDGEQHLLLSLGPTEAPEGQPPPLVRVHSQCLTGDVFHSQRCDCGAQLDAALARVRQEGAGAVLYLRQEGRGIGLAKKLQAYMLQDRGRDTVEANEELGFKADLRDYGIGAQILMEAGYRRLRLLTNNPRKLAGLESYGLEVAARVPLVTPPLPDNLRYLKAKREKLGHLLDV